MRECKGGSRRTQWKYVVPIAIVVFILPIIFSLVGRDHASTSSNHEMGSLIRRLANVDRPPVKVVDVVLHWPEQDETVRSEILAKGNEAVPFLIEGLSDENLAIRDQCATLLAELPTKDGMIALVACLKRGDGQGPSPMALHSSLRMLTGEKDVLRSIPPHVPDAVQMREYWLNWWDKSKDEIVDLEAGGIGILEEDGTVTPLGWRKQ